MTIGEKIFQKLFPKIVVHAPAEMLICKQCHQEYFSRGKDDCGICRACEQENKEKNAPLVGGVLDGKDH